MEKNVQYIFSSTNCRCCTAPVQYVKTSGIKEVPKRLEIWKESRTYVIPKMRFGFWNVLFKIQNQVCVRFFFKVKCKDIFFGFHFASVAINFSIHSPKILLGYLPSLTDLQRNKQFR